MNILVTGTSRLDYPRNGVIIDSLKKEGQVIVDSKEDAVHPHLALVKQVFQHRREVDYVFYLFPSHFVSWTAVLWRIFSPDTTVVYDAFNSIEDSYVFDRGLVSPWSPKRFLYYMLDWLKVQFADTLLFDTKEHQQFFTKFFRRKVNRKGVILPVCVDIEFLESIPPDKYNTALSGDCEILFYGNYIPLQGAEYIVEAAHLLQDESDIHFTLVGNGQTRKSVELQAREYGLENATFLPTKEYREVLACTKRADISLGIFGTTEKANRVIPNKVIEALGCGALVITGENDPMSRAFSDEENILFCKRGDAQDLVNTILKARGLSESKREMIQTNAQEVVKANHSEAVLQKKMKAILS